MKQLRGNKADIPVLDDGELGIVMDDKEVFVGVNQENIQILTATSTVDSLTNTSPTLPLSANKGKELKSAIDAVNQKLTTDVSDLNNKINQKAPTQLVTSTVDGLMSKTDKVKLDGIESGANKTAVVNNLTSTSTISALSASQGNALNQNIQGVNTNLSNHNNKNVSTSAGIHGIRYYDSQLQVNNPTTNTWDTITVNNGDSGGDIVITDGSITINKLDSTLQTKINNFIKLSDIPIVSATQNGLMTTADKVKLNSLSVGGSSVEVVDNLFSTSTDKALSAYQGKLLKDMIKSLGYNGGGNGGGSGGTGSDEIVLTEGTVYGIAIDQSNSSSLNAVTYTDDAKGFVAGAGWDNIFPFNEITPVLLNSSGVETAILDKGDYSKDVNGNTVNLYSGDNVMVRIPKIWYNIETIDNTVYIKIAKEQITTHYRCYAHTKGDVEKDYFYVGAYLSYNNSNKLKSWSSRASTNNMSLSVSRNYAKANGVGYDLLGYHQLTLLQILSLFRSKNLNSQSYYGNGWTSSDKSLGTTGKTNTYGMYYKNYYSNEKNKVMGIEDFYGMYNIWIDGVKTDEARNIAISLTNDNYNNSGAGYSLYSSGLTSDISGWVTKIQGSTEKGFIAKSVSSSESGYYSDLGIVQASSFMTYGTNGSSGTGTFNMDISNKDSGNSNISTRIMYL